MTPQLLRQLEDALRGLEYGSIQLVVHDRQEVRMERVERIRLTGSPEAQTTSRIGRPTPSTEAHRHDQEV